MKSSFYEYPPLFPCHLRRLSGAPSVPDLLLVERLPERTLQAESGISNPLPHNRSFLWALIASWIIVVLALYGVWHLWRWLTGLYGLDKILSVVGVMLAVVFLWIRRRRSTRRKTL